MSTEKSGWDKIAEQEEQSTKKEKTKENLKVAAETTSNISWIIYVVAVAIIGIIALALIILLK